MDKKLLVMVVALFVVTITGQSVKAAPAVLADMDTSRLTLHTAETEQPTGRYEGITPFWENISFIIHGCDFSTSSVNVTVKAYNNNCKISGTVTLQKLNGTSWNTVNSWGISGTGTASISKSVSFSAGRYRVKTNITADGEPITVFSSIQEYN